MTDVNEVIEKEEYKEENITPSTSDSNDDGRGDEKVDESIVAEPAKRRCIDAADDEGGNSSAEAPPPDPSQKLLNGGLENPNEDLGDSLPDEPSSGMLPLPLSKVSLDKIDFIRGPHNRVKLYVLCNQRVWDDRGTGHVACMPASDDSGAMCIIVRLEANGFENKVLESRVLLDTIYQKQQGTLIVWSETETCDLALSFQEKAGCAEIWDKICRIQGKDPDAEEENECDEQEPSDSSTSGISSGVCASSVSLPLCDLDHLPELKSALSDGIFLNTQREKLANAIQQNSYVRKLCDLFQICEDLEDMDRLRHLYGIAKSLFLLNSNSLLADLLDDKYFRDIVGMLEYDPSFLVPKKHREFLWEKSKFREILPIKSEELKAKIHQTFRVQYVLDLCLPAPSLFEENLLTVLSSHLFFNRAEIVNALLNDKTLMKQLFEELKDPTISPKRQRDLTNFLKEFCTFAHSLQPSGPQGREQFFKALMANDVLATIDPCISSVLSSTREATVELLTMIVDFNPQLFRDFLVKQFRIIPESRNDDLLINKLINHMLKDGDPEQTAANQMSNALRILLDPESIVAVNKGEKTEFLPLFYKRAMYSLCKPIMENAKDGAPLRDSYYAANRIALVIDLFCFFVDHHNYSMRAYTIQKNLLSSVLVYLKSRHHFLALCALRMCRRILNLRDELYFRYIREKGILDQIVDCFVANGPRYNLLNSALIEFFEFIRTEEIRSLMEFVVENYWDTFSTVDYVRTFSAMKQRCEQFESSRAASLRSSLSREGSCSNGSATPTRSSMSLEREEAAATATTVVASPPAGAAGAQWKKEKEYDNDELFFSKDDDEAWYKSDDNVKDEGDSIAKSSENSAEAAPQRKSGVETLFPSISRKRKANDDDGVASIFGGSITPPISNAPQSRASKIVICMSANSNGEVRSPVDKKSTNFEQTASPSSSSSSCDDEQNSSGCKSDGVNRRNDNDNDSVVSSSTLPSKNALPTSTTTSFSSAAEKCNDSSQKSPRFISSFTSNNTTSTKNSSTLDKGSTHPIILKKGLSGLVDYDESDDDSDEDVASTTPGPSDITRPTVKKRNVSLCVDQNGNQEALEQKVNRVEGEDNMTKTSDNKKNMDEYCEESGSDNTESFNTTMVDDSSEST